MKNRIKISKCLQILVLLAFFLPFFPQGCKPKQTEVAPKADSTIVSVNTTVTKVQVDFAKQTISDTAKIDTAKVASTTGTDNNKKDTDESLSNTLSKKFKILKPLLRPSDNYTGIGNSINTFQWFEMLGTAFALLLFVISLIIKLKDYNSIFHFINGLALLSLVFAHGSNIMNQDRLWGYWVCLSMAVIMVVFDTVVLIKFRKNTNL
jgi:uncharacterized membrane protein (UPF0136 family)